jgi:hypothetical protein
MTGFKTLGVVFLLAFAPYVFGVDVVTENGAADCEVFVAHRELRIFKDPTLFLPNISQIMADPKEGWKRLMAERPLLNSFKGSVSLARLGKAREFRNFGVIARLYELVEPRLRLVDEVTGRRLPSVKIVPVQICGQGTLGFVLEEDLRRAQIDEDVELGNVLPPSVYPNPIPDWKGRSRLSETERRGVARN